LISAITDPKNETEMTNRMPDANAKPHLDLAIDLSENSQAVKPIETQKLEVNQKKKFRPPSTSSSSSSESDDVEVFIEHDTNVEEVQNDFRPENKAMDEMALNLASKLTESRIGENDVIRTSQSNQKDSVTKVSMHRSTTTQER
jgi:hypothetical protein